MNWRLSHDSTANGLFCHLLFGSCTTVFGIDYTLSFYYLETTTNSLNEFQASFGGTSVFDVVDPNTQGTYVGETINLTATASSETLQFSGSTQTGYFRIDDISLVSAVPEPSSLAMCGIAGVIGLVVARARRKRSA